MWVFALLFFFFFCLFTTIVLKPMTVCTFLPLLLKSIMLLPLGLVLPILSLTKHKLRCLLKLSVSGLCLPENVLFNWDNSTVKTEPRTHAALPSFSAIIYGILWRGETSLPPEWQSPDVSIVEVILFTVRKVLSLLATSGEVSLVSRGYFKKHVTRCPKLSPGKCHGKICNLM